MFLKKSDKLAIVDFENNHITHEELVNNVKYYSKYFVHTDRKKSFNILMFENRKEWIYAFYAIWDIGSIPITIDASSSVDELKYFLEDSDAESIFVSNTTIEVAKKAIEELNKDIKLFNVDEFKVDTSKLEEIKKCDRITNHPEWDDTAVMLYTSGTTGNPKGVMLSYGNILSQIDSIKSVKDIKEDDQLIAVLPFHHILPLMITNLIIMYHETQLSVVLVEKLSSKDILTALERNRVTMLILVPRVYYLFYKALKDTIDSKWITRTIYKIANKLKSPTFSKLIFKKAHDKFGGHIRDFLAGGAKSNPEMIEFFDTIGFKYSEGYGLTETSPLIAASTPEHGKKVGTVGLPVENVEIKIVEEELWVKGPVVMKGYYNKPEKTKEVITEDGWFKTGDLVEMDKDGYISIIGRKNAMIVLSNGKNVDPEKLEFKLLEKGDGIIKELGIFGNNDKLSALIVIDKEEVRNKNVSNIHAHIKDVVEFYNASVHNYEKILDYRITENELPKTRIGKTRRFMLKDIYNSQDEVKDEVKFDEPDTPEYLKLKKFIFNMKGKYPHPDKDLEIEFGLDSLDQIELRTFIETTYGLKLEEQEFRNNLSLNKLSNLITEKGNTENAQEGGNEWTRIIENAPKISVKDGILITLIKPVIWLLFKLYFRISIKGSKKITDKPQIFVSNHESFLDVLALSLLINNKILKKTHSLAIDWYFKSAFMKFVANNSNVLLLDIENNIKETIESVAGVLKDGKNVLIFPEGTRTKDGNITEFKKSFAIIAKELNRPITCVKINGGFKAFSRYMKFPRPYKLEVSYLGEVNPEGLSYTEIVDKTKEYYTK